MFIHSGRRYRLWQSVVLNQGKSGLRDPGIGANAQRAPSRTLASFRELDSGVIEQARAKAAKAIDAAELRGAARRAGAPRLDRRSIEPPAS